MKLIGESSLSSVLNWIINIAFGVGILVGLYIIGSVVIVWSHSDDLSDYQIITSFELPTEGYSSDYKITPVKDDSIQFTMQQLTGQFRYLKMPKSFVLIILCRYGILLFLYFIIVIQLAKFFKTLTNGHPFVKENGKRIQIIGLSIILGALFNFLIQTGSFILLKSQIHLEGAHFPLLRYSLMELHPITILTGFIILVIAEIFRLGTRLQEEQELTI